MSAEIAGGEAVEVRHVPERHRYEIVVDGVEAGHAEYEERDGALVFTHTRIRPDYGERGLGTTLIRAALDDVRANGGRIVAQCPFVAAFLEHHADYADLEA